MTLTNLRLPEFVKELDKKYSSLLSTINTEFFEKYKFYDSKKNCPPDTAQ